MADLKPCPFCGGKATMFTGPTAGLSEIGHVDPVRYVLCDDCAASSFDDHVTEEDAAGNWNARVDAGCRQSATGADVLCHTPAVLALVEACRNVFDDDGNPPIPNTSRAVAIYTDVAAALAAVEKEISP